MHAILFLYREVLEIKLPWLDGITRAKTGTDIRTIQELLGHSDVETTMIYTHVLNRGPGGGLSPLDKVIA